MSQVRSFAELRRALEPERAALVEHALYGRVTSLAAVRTFTEHHVFAVWDFMSLLKALQRELTCVDVPWVPRGGALGRRLINEIVVAEESDVLAGGHASHFELYRAAMLAAGADVAPIDAFVARVRRGDPVELPLRLARAPQPSQAFVRATFDALRSGSLARIAAAFTLGREDVIPAMFLRLIEKLAREPQGALELLRDYFERHVRLDADEHGPMAARLLEEVCGDDPEAWKQAHAGAREALRARAALWRGVAAALPAVALAERP